MFKFTGLIGGVLLPTLALGAASGGGVHGDGTVSRLLGRAHDIDVPRIVSTVNPSDANFDAVIVRSNDTPTSLREVYAQISKTLLKDLSQFPLRATQEPIQDNSLGYHTWIGIDLEARQIIYNPAKFAELEISLPSQDAMNEAILHEMGHYYGLDEDGCHSLARILIFADRQKKPAIETERRIGTNTPPSQADAPRSRLALKMVVFDNRATFPEFKITHPDVAMFKSCSLRQEATLRQALSDEALSAELIRSGVKRVIGTMYLHLPSSRAGEWDRLVDDSTISLGTGGFEDEIGCSPRPMESLMYRLHRIALGKRDSDARLRR